MKTIILNLLDSSRERLKNPIVGSFIIAWLVLNWKPISIFLFEDLQMIEKIRIIEFKYSSNWNFLWFPLIFSFLYNLAMTYILSFLELIVSKGIKNRYKNQIQIKINEIKNKTSLAEHEFILENTKAGFREVDQTNRIIDNLKKENENLKNENILLKENLNQQKSISLEEMRNSSEEIAFKEDYNKNFVNSDLYKFFKQLGTAISQNNLPKLEPIILEKFINTDIIDKYETVENEVNYKFTQRGKIYWKIYVSNFEIDKDLNDVIYI
jgi:hypothetical protein